MIAEITQDLVDKINTVVALTGNVGVALGGTGIDPMNVQRPCPWAIVAFDGDEGLGTSADGGKLYQQTILHFYVMIVQDYATTDNWEGTMMATSFPLLDSVITALHGKLCAPTFSSNWLYNGQALHTQDSGKLIFVQHYSVVGLRTD